MSNATTILCQCGREHAVFWYVNPKGSRKLMYRCDKFKEMNLEPKQGEPAFKLVKKDLEVMERHHENRPGLGKDAPEKWSKGWAAEQDKKKQGVLL